MVYHATFTAAPSAYVRGAVVIAVPPEDDLVSKTPAAALAQAFAGNRYSYRERGYLMSPVAFRYFTRAVSLGCKVVRDDVIGWEEPGGARSVTFSAKHPKSGLRECQRRE